MATNYASKFAGKVAEAFHLGSITDSARGTAFNFTGVKTLRVMSVDTVPLNDYARSGANRYGTPVELGDTVQEMTMREDKSFSMTIDKGNDADQLNLKGAARAMRRETEQVMIPYVDRYRLREWAHHAGLIVEMAAAPTKTTIVDMLFTAGAEMDDALVPREGRTLFLTNKHYAMLKSSGDVIGNDALGKKIITRGDMGEFDGMTVKRVPDSYMPKNVYFIIKYKGSTVDPVKLNESNLHQDPPGISGHLLEGRFYHDSFVLGAKANGIYVAVAKDTKAKAPTVTAGTGENVGKVKLATTTPAATVYYTVDGSDPRYSKSAKAAPADFFEAEVEQGKRLRCYATAADLFQSDVTEDGAGN